MARALGKIDGRTLWRRRRWLSAPLPRSMLTRNGPTLVRPYAYTLDGGDYFTSPNTSDFNVTTGNYTWIFYMRFGVVNAAQNIWGKRTEVTNTDGPAAGILSTGYLRLIHHDTGTTGSSYRDSAAALSAATDYALAFSREGTTLHLYINGAASEGTQTNSGTVTTLSTSVAFEISAQHVSTWGKLSNGSRIHAAAFYATNLSAAEIAVIGNALRARARFAWD